MTTAANQLGTRRSRPGRRWLLQALRCAAALALACVVGGPALFLLADAAAPFPLERLDGRPVSALVTDRAGRTLAAVVGPDDQWRRPVPLAAMSSHLVDATIAIEDERFRMHPGVDPLAVVRAALQNTAAREVVSGASTITMQVARMVEPRPRTLAAKGIEAFRALQLERLRGKDAILEAYLNLAPYGGNVRGVESAARRWFGRGAGELTLAESALLAGLPQSPERLRPDRFPAAACARRDRVIDRMERLGLVTGEAARAARATPVRLAAPFSDGEGLAMHAATLARSRRVAGGPLALDASLQESVLDLVSAARHGLPEDADLAVVVLEIDSGAARAWIGSADGSDPRDGQVDGARAWRSPGSALKPFLYLAAFDAGRLGLESMVPDRPIVRDGWTPRNFDRKHAGVLPARTALRESANVPAILVAEAMGVHRCVGVLEAAGVRFRPGAPVRAGLALAVGAAEVRLIDLVNAYATIGRGGVAMPWRLFEDDPIAPGARIASRVACRLVDEALAHADAGVGGWAMWKTGTSAGHRDAWAVGHNGRFAAGVWVGRFSGAGDAAFTGATAAAPVLAALFELPSVRADVPAALPEVAPLVRRPIELDADEPLRITTPVDGAVYHGVDGVVRLRPRAAGTDRGGGAVPTWLLDGRRLTAAELDPLVPGPGWHELRCIDGASAAVVRFVVRPAPADARHLVRPEAIGE